MAEVSYPFSQANSSGGTEMVSQVQWQQMAHLWGGDRVDYQLTSSTLDPGALPFAWRVINGRTISIDAGNAWVGGFYYQNTAPLNVEIDPNPTDRARKDTIVIRADVVKGSVNIVAVKGQPSISPIAPRPQRSPGGIWEMVLLEVDVPAANGALSVYSRASYDLPRPVATPWNTRSTADFIPKGTFIYDLDQDGGDSPYEAFAGRDGYMVTRHLGKARPYTPTLWGVNNQPAEVDRVCWWRWIAPNAYHFNMKLRNSTSADIVTTGWYMQASLPNTANGRTAQVFQGYIDNPAGGAGKAWMTSVTGVTWEGPGTTAVNFYTPAGDSLNVLQGIPAHSTLYLSGTVESDIFTQ
ncbi:hypothetical protein ACFRMQ_06095 [Kitasatospora sp. NPDC056783]|uniref:hypothetical protein n=1 Tax=Kitasatospora sp. NPDC056783 TaxID=3345943 RepID=UPI00367E9F79